MRKPNTVCHECGEPCYVRPNQMRDQKSWFCSKWCYKKNRQKTLMGKCKQCGIAYVKPSSESKYCSRSCSNIARAGIKYKMGKPGCNIERAQYQRFALVERDGVNCVLCKQKPIWNGKALKLQIDHIDGDRTNNELDNLRLLCPNCHTQTETWAVRKSK